MTAVDTFTQTEGRLRQLLGPGLLSHVPIQQQLAFGVGGVADFFLIVSTVAALIQAVTAAETLGIPYLVVGHGSQTLFSDYGFAGLVILNRTNRIEFVPTLGHVLVDSGVTWPQIVLASASRGFGGFEGFLLADGTVGGTLVQRRSTPLGSAADSLLRGVTILQSKGTISRLKSLPRSGRGDAPILLLANLQLVQTRRDELLRRIRGFEQQRRRLHHRARRWLGPIFHSDLSLADPTYLTRQFQRAHVFQLQTAGAVFSLERPNYIEARGRVTARTIRQFVRQIYDRLSDIGPAASLTCHLKFVGSWGDEVTDA